MIEFIDTHVHLDAGQYQPDLEEVLERAKVAGVTRFISIGASEGIASAKASVALSSQHEFVYSTVGIHPHSASEDFSVDDLRTLAKSSKKVVAIGETGLDFYRDWAPRDRQEKLFRDQINLAIELALPLIIHSREAGVECLKILKELGAEKVGGVFHCYSENAVFASKLREVNFKVSFPGSLTFKKAEALRHTAKEIPLDQIMLETDGPFLAPEPYRGKRCESAHLIDTAKVLAAVKEISLEDLAKSTTMVAEELFPALKR